MFKYLIGGGGEGAGREWIEKEIRKWGGSMGLKKGGGVRNGEVYIIVVLSA